MTQKRLKQLRADLCSFRQDWKGSAPQTDLSNSTQSFIDFHYVALGDLFYSN